ncbi:MAG: ATP-dependent DNA helicase RecG, partial [Phycisphaeraceae bacterium]|nr:ATP-dependent DNA helicase RecG [Phycisphaeraceae bacterium]
TAAQERVVGEIASDLQRETPTSRLVQGDVGSGKTVVALYAMLMAVASRWQGALMAPTELLAEQHHRSITAMLAGSDVRVELLTGSMDPRHRAAALRRIAAGEADIIIGTHALLTDRVRFHSLAVAVIDEQHKFGVHQRAELRSRAEDADPPHPLTPHVLVMTATPIPRTLALSLLGDLEVSTIDELPPGRKAITTRTVDPDRLDEVMRYVRRRLDKGEQAYIVVPAIEPGSPLLDPIDGPRTSRPTGLVEVKTRLEKGPLAGLRLAAVHGRLDRDARECVMQRFRAGEIDALIATTVIEVGVDVPNATVMVILDADRFGLAQLHQLRGRVGRGSKASACILVGRASTPEGQARLEALATLSDGFKLAERDLEIRGFGDVAGIRQSGAPPFKVADLAKDVDLLLMARRDAASLVLGSSGLDDAGAALLRRRVIKSHGKWLGIADTA